MHSQSHYRWINVIVIVIVTVQGNVTTACILQNSAISNRCACYFPKDSFLRVLKPKNRHDSTSSQSPSDDRERNLPQLFHRLQWKYHLSDALWKFSQHKNVRNKPEADGACSNAPGTETAQLDFIQMFYAMKIFSTYSRYILSDSQKKNYGRENTPLTRTEKKIVTQAPSYEHIFKPLFQCFLCCTASWLEWCGFSHF